jgi:hypothetical protein
MKYIIPLTLLLMGNHVFSQFPSTESYILCSEIPKAKKIGDSVYVNTCMKSGEGYVLQKIDTEGRYKYKGLDGGKSLIWITYDSLDKVQSYSYEYNGHGGSGKGYFLIHYYENGNIKDYLDYSRTFNSMAELYIFDSLSYKETNLSKLTFKKYYLYQKRKRFYVFDKDGLERKIIRKTIRKFQFKKVHLIDDFPYCIYQRVE